MDKEVYKDLSKEDLLRVIGNLNLRLRELEGERDILKRKKDAPQPINIINKQVTIGDVVKNNPRGEDILIILDNPDAYRLSVRDVKFLKSIGPRVGLSDKQIIWFEGIKKRLK
ncbi:hypothetical protein UFOVP54_104 [uncultured Caudovirales phage]|uniref:Uncharacterized protein n=1 Tax=uncultured Caudovirales phage TaxID=2100421 RepID=A0A6J5KZC3_9CAUD|nr:hypothetical protein UFOVP54_104 [uncultured Caudovirales phage]